MKSTISALATSASVFVLGALPALANGPGSHGIGWGKGGKPKATSVPEIDASTGLLALAAVLAVLAFAYERRRRAL